MSANLREEHHDRALKTPALWQMMGTDLLAAGAHLVQRATCLDPARKTFDPGVLGPGLMIRGLGIENLLKGLFVLRGGTLGTDKNAGDMPCRQHDLPKMAEIVAAESQTHPRDEGLAPTTAEERAMLLALCGCLHFAGRYPIPRRSEDVVLHTRDSRDDRIVWSRAHERAFESLLERLLWPFFAGKTVQTEGKELNPEDSNKLLRQMLAQAIERSVCREWIQSGGRVGDDPQTPWATMYHER